MSEPITRERLQVRYAEVQGELAAIEKNIAPLRGKLRAAADEAERYRVKSMAVAEELNVARGGKKFFALKKELGMLAKLLGGQ